MRHAKAGNRLGRNSALRRATLRDLAKATLLQERICTTKPKAQEARKLVDRLITFGKHGTLSDRRRAFAILCDHRLVSDLFQRISPRFKSRLGGYTRIISLAKRRGDNAQLAFLELTEKEKITISKPKTQAQAKPAPAPGAVLEKKPGKDLKTEVKPQPEVKKEPLKSEPMKPHPQKELPSKGKPNFKSNIMSGIKRMFIKRPPSTGS